MNDVERIDKACAEFYKKHHIIANALIVGARVYSEIQTKHGFVCYKDGESTFNGLPIMAIDFADPYRVAAVLKLEDKL